MDEQNNVHSMLEWHI